jgi:hypothetical protein
MASVRARSACDFLNAKERTWQAMYDYDFAAGAPGLKSRLRYVRGDHIELAALNAGRPQGARIPDGTGVCDPEWSAEERRADGAQVDLSQ